MSDLQMQHSDAMRYVWGLWLANRYQDEQIAELRALVSRQQAELTKAREVQTALYARIAELETAAEEGEG